jgi:hypothetical protein
MTIASFAPSAYGRYGAYDSLKHWARTEARRYYHECDNSVRFADVYYALIQYADDALTEEQALQDAEEETETSSGKNELNGILFR